MPSFFVMDIRQLSTFLAVVDHGGFTSASKALLTVQSNVSAHVSRLEAELGATLIDRATGDPTPEGEVVAEHTRRILLEMEALRHDVHSVRSAVTGTARIGLIGTTARWLVPPLIDTMAARHPLVRVEVHDATTATLRVQLRSAAIDLAVLSTPVDDPEITSVPLFVEDRILATPRTHPLAGRSSITLADLDGVPLIVEPANHPFRLQLEQLFAERGWTMAVKAEIDGTRLMASLAFEGYGPTILPASAVSNRPDLDWSITAIEGVPGRAVGLASRRQGLLSAATRALRDVVRQVVAEQAIQQPGVHPASESQ